MKEFSVTLREKAKRIDPIILICVLGMTLLSVITLAGGASEGVKEFTSTKVMTQILSGFAETVLLMLLWTVAAITGVILLPLPGEGAGLGRWHYILGLLASIVALGHLLKRLPLLRNSIKRKKVAPT